MSEATWIQVSWAVNGILGGMCGWLFMDLLAGRQRRRRAAAVADAIAELPDLPAADRHATAVLWMRLVVGATLRMTAQETGGRAEDVDRITRELRDRVRGNRSPDHFPADWPDVLQLYEAALRWSAQELAEAGMVS